MQLINDNPKAKTTNFIPELAKFLEILEAAIVLPFLPSRRRRRKQMMMDGQVHSSDVGHMLLQRS